MRVIIGGAGTGSEKTFTAGFIEAVKDADEVLTFARLADPLKRLNKNVRVMGVMDIISYIKENAHREGTILVAASGDTGFYSIASTITRMVGEEIDIQFMAGIGSLAYFMSKIKKGYEDVKLISLHGKNKSILPYVCYNEYVFSLSGGTVKAGDIVKELCENGLEDVYVYIGENLSSEEERIIEGRAEDLIHEVVGDLAVIVIHNENYVNRFLTLNDEDFLRGKSPMTKAAVRNLSVSALEIEPEDVVYDIGAGTGSVTCAMALKACESTVYAVEKESYALDLLQKNMDKLKIRNIKYVHGLAPEGMEGFPAADKVFIGGSSGNLKEIVETVLCKNKNAVFVVTAVTLETLNEAVTLFNTKDFNGEVSCINVSNARRLGRYNLMMAENPIYIIKGVKNFEK